MMSSASVGEGEGAPPEGEKGASGLETVHLARRFGTFTGVFRPTILTILGALLYLREGWVVGHAGLGGFVLILVAMYVITGSTALSLSSITTNIRIGHGGVFSIICQSMGLEAGGAIGLPFYLAQALGGALYIFAFAEGWAFIFPDHPQELVVAAVFLSALALSMRSATLAFRVQGVVLLGVLFALGSAWMGLDIDAVPAQVALFNKEDGPGLVALFALFFPAATGIMVGASMSGNLEEPRQSIPRGTLAAVGVSFFVYLAMGIWYALVAPPEILRTNYRVMVDQAFWGPAILIGLLSSTFSATLSSVVAAPRVLQALGSFNVVPGGSFFAAQTPSGEPRNALLVTAVLVALGLLSGSIDALAPLLTIFFLITYASINLVVLIEQGLGLISFRPLFPIPRAVPLVGLVSCLLAILATSPIVGLVALSVVFAVYGWLSNRHLDTPFETVRSGLFVNIADWAAKLVASLPPSSERSWKPDIFVPLMSDLELQGNYRLLRALTWPKGSLKLVGLDIEGATESVGGIPSLAEDFKKDGIYTTQTSLRVSDYGAGARLSLSVMKGAFFPPNIAFVSLPGKEDSAVQGLRALAQEIGIGMLIYAPHARAALGRERTINVWVRDQSPDWTTRLKMASLDLSLLSALQLQKNWGAQVNLICVVTDPTHEPMAREFLDTLKVEARIPGEPEVTVVFDTFDAYVPRCPVADINIFGMPHNIHGDWMRGLTQKTRSSCLFVMASGKESALA